MMPPSRCRSSSAGQIGAIGQMTAPIAAQANISGVISQRFGNCTATKSPRRTPIPTPEMIETLERERDRMTERIQLLTRNRDAIAEYLEEVLEGDRRRRAAS